MSIFPLLIIFVLLFTVVKLTTKNKELKNKYHALVVDIQSTENIKTIEDYQDRTFVTKLKQHIIYTDMDDSRSYTVQKN